ncbi:hypothetical protein S245_004520 [Arachis hypogaea]
MSASNKLTKEIFFLFSSMLFWTCTLKCTYLRMESLGVPCDHILPVLIHVELSDIPDNLVLDHWSKNAHSKVRTFVEKAPFCWDSMITLDAE